MFGAFEQIFGANQQIQHAGGSVKEAEKPSRQCDASSCASQFCQRQEVIMRVKFEATDATGKVHKRGSRSRVYSRGGMPSRRAVTQPLTRTGDVKQ